MKQPANKPTHQNKQPLPAVPSRQAAPNLLPSPMREAPGGTLNAQPLNEAAPSFLIRMRLGERILLPLRLFLGVTFVYAGIQKFSDPQFFNPTAIGYIGGQIIAISTNTPISALLLHVALPHAKFFGVVIALGEIAIGLGTLFGFLLRPAAFFGLLLNLMFFLSASWHTYPYFYGSDIVFVFAWITLLLAGPLRSGMATLDGLLVPRFLERFSPEAQVWTARLAGFFLGVGVAHDAQYTPQVKQVQQVYQQRQPQQISYKARIAAQRRSMDNRRNFLWGMVVGGLGILGITLVSREFHFGDDTGAATQIIANTPGSTAAGSGTATPGSSNVIAQVSAVAANSAVTFTIPSNGDPGVLIHLNNGKFVCYDATCTHAGCPVSFDSGSSLLVCPCHGAEFDPANNASVVQGPAQTPLTSVPINVNTATGAIALK